MSKPKESKLIFDYKIPEFSTIPAGFINIVFGDRFLDNQINQPVMIDTGYDGYLVIPRKLFNELKLFKYLIPNLQAVGEVADGGIINFTIAKGRIKIFDINFDINVEIDTFNECIRPLIGRALINKFNTEFRGPDSQLLISIR